MTDYEEDYRTWFKQISDMGRVPQLSNDKNMKPTRAMQSPWVTYAWFDPYTNGEKIVPQKAAGYKEYRETDAGRTGHTRMIIEDNGDDRNNRATLRWYTFGGTHYRVQAGAYVATTNPAAPNHVWRYWDGVRWWNWDHTLNVGAYPVEIKANADPAEGEKRYDRQAALPIEINPVIPDNLKFTRHEASEYARLFRVAPLDARYKKK